jgi:hypothetical protein
MLPRFPWNHRTTSTGNPHERARRREAGSWNGLRSGACARFFGSGRTERPSRMRIDLGSRRQRFNWRYSPGSADRETNGDSSHFIRVKSRCTRRGFNLLMTATKKTQRNRTATAIRPPTIRIKPATPVVCGVARILAWYEEDVLGVWIMD